MSSPILTRFSTWARCQCLVKLTSTMMSNNQPTELTVAGGLRPGSTDRPAGVAEVGTGPDLHRGSSLSQASRRLSGSQPRHALEWHATHSFSHLNLQHEPHENAAVWPDPCLWACNLKSKRPPRGVWLLFLHALVDKDGQIRLHGQSGDENQLACSIRSHSYRWPAERVAFQPSGADQDICWTMLPRHDGNSLRERRCLDWAVWRCQKFSVWFHDLGRRGRPSSRVCGETP